MKTCASLLLLGLGLGCHSDNPPREAAPVPLATRAAAPGPSLTLHIAPDGSIQALDQVVYDPRLGDEASFQAFLARQRAQDPDLALNFLADPGTSTSMIEQASKLVGADMRDRATFKIGGSVQVTLRGH